MDPTPLVAPNRDRTPAVSRDQELIGRAAALVMRGTVAQALAVIRLLSEPRASLVIPAIARETDCWTDDALSAAISTPGAYALLVAPGGIVVWCAGDSPVARHEQVPPHLREMAKNSSRQEFHAMLGGWLYQVCQTRGGLALVVVS